MKIGQLRSSLSRSLDFDQILLLVSAIFYVIFNDFSLKSKLPFQGKKEFIRYFSDIIHDSKKKKVLSSLIKSIENIFEKISDDDYLKVLEISIDQITEDSIASEIYYQFEQVGYTAEGSLTPSIINDLLVKLADIKKSDTVLDPTVGIGGTLFRVLLQEKEQVVVGQDINTEHAAFAQLLLEISGGKNSKVFRGDVLADPEYVEGGELMKFDKVVTVPPFGIRLEKTDFFNDKYYRFPFGEPSRSTADWAFISNAVSSTKIDSGKVVMVVPNGVLFRGGADKRIRERMLKYDLFETIISLPPKIFHNTTIPTTILIFNRDKDRKRQNKIQFIKVSEATCVKRGSINELSEEEVTSIIKTYQSFIDVENYSVVVSNDDIDPSSMLVENYITDSKFVIGGESFRVDLKKFQTSKTQALSEIASISRGFNMTLDNEALNGKYRILKISDIDGDHINYQTTSKVNIEERTKVENYEIEHEDIILSIRGATTKVAIADDPDLPTIINSNLVRIRVNSNDYLPEFVKLFMESPVGMAQFNSFSMGTTVRQLPIAKLKDYRIPNIPLEQQLKFVSFFKEKEKQIEIEFNRLRKEQIENKDKLYQNMGIEKLYEKL